MTDKVSSPRVYTGWVTEGIDLKFPFSFPVAELQYCFTRYFFVGNIVFFRHQVEKSGFYWRIFIVTNWFNDELSSEFLGNTCFPVAMSMRIVVFDKLTLGIYVFMTIFGQKNNVTNIFSSVKFLKYDLSLVFVIKKFQWILQCLKRCVFLNFSPCYFQRLIFVSESHLLLRLIKAFVDQ